MVGGTTYEESRAVALQNATNSGVRFILGGSVILNSKRYVLFPIRKEKIVLKHIEYSVAGIRYC